MRFSFSFSSSTMSSPSPSSLPPPPPPPSPNDDLLDITPRKSSFSTSLGMSTSCAFPSWPNRPSLLSGNSDCSTPSSYLSDEDLFPDSTSSPSDAIIDEDSAIIDPVCGAFEVTTEQQIQMMRAAAEEEERRMRYLAQVQAHARAQQATRVAQLAAAERENARRKKRRAVPEKKRRSTSSSSKTPVQRS